MFLEDMFKVFVPNDFGFAFENMKRNIITRENYML